MTPLRTTKNIRTIAPAIRIRDTMPIGAPWVDGQPCITEDIEVSGSRTNSCTSHCGCGN